MKRLRVPLLILPPFAAIALALALSLLAPATRSSASSLKDSGLTILATGPVITTGLNTTYIILNQLAASPAASGSPHLLLDFWSNDVLTLHLPFTLTLSPGPNVFPVSWSTAAFSPTYDAHADNLLTAQWLDADGRVVDTALRSFSRFAADALPSAALDPANVWDFGTVPQGTLLARTFAVANTGASDLAVYMDGAAFAEPYHRLVPGDLATYDVKLDTVALPPAPYSHTLTVRSSDPAAPLRTILISGTLAPPAAPSAVFAQPEHPWDRRVVVYGSVAENASVYFTDNAPLDDSATDPCTLSDASGATVKGVSRICLDPGGGAFGDGGSRLLLERLDGPLMRLNVPEDVAGGAAYTVRFGKLYTFGDGGGALSAPVHVISQTYASAAMDALITNVGAWGSLSLQVMAGDTSIYSQTMVITQPAVIHLPGLAAAFNRYLAAHPPAPSSDVPFQLTLDSAADVLLTNFSLVPAPSIDLSIGPGDITFGSPVMGYTLTEGLVAPVTATVHNAGATASGPLVISFITVPAITGTASGPPPQYLPSALLPNVPAGGSASASIAWNTTGVTGAVSVTAIVDPLNRLPELSGSNRSADAALALISRPNVNIARIQPADIEPYPNAPIATAVVLRNTGQTDALSLTVALYDGDASAALDPLKLKASVQPPAGAIPVSRTAATAAANLVPPAIVLIGSRPLNVASGAEVTTTLVWTPTRAGPHRLIALASADGAAPPPALPDRLSYLPVYVGFRGPILIDSGGASDVAYTPAVGYGYLGANAGVSRACGAEAYHTFRQGASASLQYRIDNFQPDRAYHLDLTFGECDGAGRRQRVLVNGVQVLGAVDLSDEQPHRVSLRPDPALYAGSVVTLTFEELNGHPALAGEVHIYEVDYRDVLAGSPSEQPYPLGMATAVGGRSFGYLNGIALPLSADQPGPFMRIETGTAELRYRFDQLDPARRYALNLSFDHRFPLTPTLHVALGNFYSSPEFSVPYGQPYAINVAIPRAAYVAGGSITVSISRTDIVSGSFVNELALEEQTLGPTLSSADLVLLAPQSPHVITAGVPVTYELLLINNGPDAAGDVVLNATAPAGARLAGAVAGGFCDGATQLSCSLGAFPSGASASLLLVLTPATPGALSIPVSIDSSTTDPYPANNSVLLSSDVVAAGGP